MSRVTDLIRQAKEKDPTLGLDLEAEFAALSSRRQFGLNFERHQPEAVELPGRPPRKGDKVRVLPPRGSTGPGDPRLWKVASIALLDGIDIARLQITDDDGVVLESAEPQRHESVSAEILLVNRCTRSDREAVDGSWEQDIQDGDTRSGAYAGRSGFDLDRSDAGRTRRFHALLVQEEQNKGIT